MFVNPEKIVHEFGFLPGQKVADFGAGSGHYSLALSQLLGSEGRVFAVDLQKEILVRLKRLVAETGRENVDIIVGDVEVPKGTTLGDGVADGVVLSNIFFQLTDPKGAIEEAKRVIKQNGRICVVEWTDNLPAGKTGFSEEKMKKLFAEAGLVFERRFEAGNRHYAMIFRK